jgi:Flp pilus assembly secretin CpaC
MDAVRFRSDVERKMMALSLRCRTWSGLSISIVLGLWLMLAMAPAARSDSDLMTVTLDQAKLIKLPSGITTMVIGNPLIVDAALQPGGTAVLTGKGFGETNMMALDRGGNVLFEKTVRVQSPRDAVVVYRGIARETYTCAPICESQIALGDFDATFKANLAQSLARNAAAQAAAR